MVSNKNSYFAMACRLLHV